MSSLKSLLCSKKCEDALIVALRISIGIIFVWFGFLKISGHNPVADLVQYSMVPFFADGNGLIILGALEAIIGILILSNRFLVFTYTVMLLHLAGTFSTFIYGWHLVFSPYFPILSMGGEFVVKNVVLIIAGLVVLAHEERGRMIKS